MRANGALVGVVAGVSVALLAVGAARGHDRAFAPLPSLAVVPRDGRPLTGTGEALPRTVARPYPVERIPEQQAAGAGVPEGLTAAAPTPAVGEDIRGFLEQFLASYAESPVGAAPQAPAQCPGAAPSGAPGDAPPSPAVWDGRAPGGLPSGLGGANLGGPRPEPPAAELAHAPMGPAIGPGTGKMRPTAEELERARAAQATAVVIPACLVKGPHLGKPPVFEPPRPGPQKEPFVSSPTPRSRTQD